MVSLFDVSVLSFIYRRVFLLHVSSVRTLSYAKIMIYVKKNKQYASFLLNVCSY